MKLTNKIMLITYADSLGKNLSELKEMLETYFHSVLSVFGRPGICTDAL